MFTHFITNATKYKDLFLKYFANLEEIQTNIMAAVDIKTYENINILRDRFEMYSQEHRETLNSMHLNMVIFLIFFYIFLFF